MALAEAYLQAGVVPERYREDCEHVAIATVARVDVLVSWNFRHIVRYDRIRQFSGVSLRRGYLAIEIRSPLEMVEYEDEGV